ncbi:hypothetical protein MYOV003v1_p0061 [Vibrio phage 207E48.1]|nr:hypothetical protein MYOV003v1_p0061 [Vibrio phage 207E48.1]
MRQSRIYRKILLAYDWPEGHESAIIEVSTSKVVWSGNRKDIHNYVTDCMVRCRQIDTWLLPTPMFGTSSRRIDSELYELFDKPVVPNAHIRLVAIRAVQDHFVKGTKLPETHDVKDVMELVNNLGGQDFDGKVVQYLSVLHNDAVTDLIKQTEIDYATT